MTVRLTVRATWLAAALAAGGVARATDPLTPEQIALASTARGQVRPNDPHWDLEVLYFRQDFDAGLAAARAKLAAHPDDVDLYWHVARFLFEQGEQFPRETPTSQKLSLYEEMTRVSEAGGARAPNHAHLQFAWGIAQGRLATTRGVLRTLFVAKDVEQAWIAAASSEYAYRSIDGGEQLPCDAQLTLGIFYRIVPDSWVVKALSGTRGDLDRSLTHLRTADACAGPDIGILKEYGVTQLCIADKRHDTEMLERGRQTLNRALRIPSRADSTDVLDHVHIRMLLDDPSLACEYSRDGQQDLDESQLEAPR
jgi:hypothetical protein